MKYNAVIIIRPCAAGHLSALRLQRGNAAEQRAINEFFRALATCAPEQQACRRPAAPMQSKMAQRRKTAALSCAAQLNIG
ncbi:hypothetical protein [Acinetobacter sp. WCHAc010034]|uniref:hypothetical protein n=1 Tax=Acinetobacter sp. WCHAc010034 TaxID=1879049 RepID=UPI0013C33ECD|nr:hypothetical protein [Acinetobacter sp. WCHAc010034]